MAAGKSSLWLSEDAIAAWIPPKNGLRGGQRRYSNPATSPQGGWKAETNTGHLIQTSHFSRAVLCLPIYQIARTFYETNTFPGQLLKLCRRWAEDRNRERWLRTYSIAILGAAGNASDLSAIETSYASATDELERAEIARALARMELSRRNAFYRRVCKDGDMVSWAIEDAVSRTEQN